MTDNVFENVIDENIQVLINGLKEIDLPRLDLSIQKVIDCLFSSRKVYICGNGGSATLADHFATDWSKGISDIWGKKCNAISLNANIGLFSAIANDFGYENIFSWQIDSFAKKGDLLVLISSSGKSKNIIKAAEMAKNKGMEILGLVGNSGGDLLGLIDYSFIVKSNNTQFIEDMHSLFGHLVYNCAKKAMQN